jgi:hypothetical protein
VRKFVCQVQRSEMHTQSSVERLQLVLIDATDVRSKEPNRRQPLFLNVKIPFRLLM